MIPTNVNTEAGWRNHWFIKNVLTELPIIGGFFHTSRKSDILQSACKSTAMLVGGSTAMMLGMMMSKKDDMDMGSSCNNNMALQMTEMAIGMSIGAVAYNSVYNAGRMCYQYHQFVSTKKAMVASNTVQLEKQSPVTSDEPVSATMSDSDSGFNPFSHT